MFNRFLLDVAVEGQIRLGVLVFFVDLSNLPCFPSMQQANLKHIYMT